MALSFFRCCLERGALDQTVQQPRDSAGDQTTSSLRPQSDSQEKPAEAEISTRKTIAIPPTNKITLNSAITTTEPQIVRRQLAPSLRNIWNDLPPDMKEEIVRQSAAIKPINIAAKSLVQFSRASIAMNATVKTILSTNEHAKLNSFITEHSQFHSSWRQLHQCIDPLFSFLDRHLKDKIKSVADNYAAVKVDFDHCGIHFARVVLAGVLESEARVLRFEIANFKLSWLDRYDVTLMATPPEIERRAGREIHIVAKRLIDMPSHLSYLLPINQNTTLVDICACEFYGPGKFADIDNLEDLIPLSRAKVLRFTFYPIDTNSAEALPNTLENSSKLVEIKLNSYHQHMKRSAETMLEHFYGTL